MMVPIVGIFVTGGVADTKATILEVNPDTLQLFKGISVFTIISGIAWGLGYFGQPHIIVRFMAISSAKETTKARRIGIGWMILCFVIFQYYELVYPETVFIDLV